MQGSSPAVCGGRCGRFLTRRLAAHQRGGLCRDCRLGRWPAQRAVTAPDPAAPAGVASITAAAAGASAFAASAASPAAAPPSHHSLPSSPPPSKRRCLALTTLSEAAAAAAAATATAAATDTLAAPAASAGEQPLPTAGHAADTLPSVALPTSRSTRYTAAHGRYARMHALVLELTVSVQSERLLQMSPWMRLLRSLRSASLLQLSPPRIPRCTQPSPMPIVSRATAGVAIGACRRCASCAKSCWP